MIRRLRIKFVCINMTIVTIMLCAIFGLVIHFTSANLEKESIRMMQSAALVPRRLGVPGQGAPAGVWLPCFTLRFGAGGELEASGSDCYDLTDRALLEELAALSVQKSGVLADYGLRYVRVVTPTAQCIVFADMSGEVSTMNHLIQSCLAIGAASFLLFLLVSVLLAHWAVRPVAAAWEQQRRFVADASHELKTPLTVILSSAQMLSESGGDPEIRGKLTANILTVSRQMRDLVTRLLDAARADQGAGAMDFAPVDWSGAVSGAVLAFEPVFYEREMELDSEIQPGLRVPGSLPHLTRTVEILLDNAQKYSAPRGRTCVTLRRFHRKSCLLKVANEGGAMSARELRDIFKRFYRADAARARTGSYGLGLSIAESIVKAHRGRIWAESRDGVNTFFVLLPVTAERRHPSAGRPPKEENGGS